MHNFLILGLSLLLIVFSSMLFCNALEHMGEKLGISEGVTGSIFAAVGTALPETIIPLLALLGLRPGTANTEIGIGAILGAPLMLSTLSLCVMAFSVIKKRGFNGAITPEYTGLRRDLKFFLFGYFVAFLATFVQSQSWHKFFNILIVILLGISYFIYLLLTIKDSLKHVNAGHGTVATEKFFLQHFAIKANRYTITVQLILAIMILVYFADVFIDSVNNIVSLYNVSGFIIALIIIPIATELPEKINSILWLRKGKDTLAISNITGALVFQGTLLPIVGIIFTDWSMKNHMHLIAIAGTFIATLWLYYNAKQANIRVWQFSFNGLLYLVNILTCIYFFKS